jgi:hypothetical protein
MESHSGGPTQSAIRALDLTALRLLVLNVCDGGVYRYGRGDEPYGSVPALVASGVENVVRCEVSRQRRAAAEFMIEILPARLEDKRVRGDSQGMRDVHRRRDEARLLGSVCAERPRLPKEAHEYLTTTTAPDESRGTVELRASSLGEAAQESAELSGAVFTHFLISGLRGGADAAGRGG